MLRSLILIYLVAAFGNPAFAFSQGDEVYYNYRGEGYYAKVLNVVGHTLTVQFTNWIMPSYPVELPDHDFLAKDTSGERESVLIEGHRMTGTVVARDSRVVVLEFNHPLMRSVPYVFSIERIRRDATCADHVQPKRRWYQLR